MGKTGHWQVQREGKLIGLNKNSALMDRTRKGMAKYPGLLLSNHKPDNSFAMKTGHLEMLLTSHFFILDKI